MESTLQKEATLEQAIDLGLRTEEFEMIKEILGRTPNFTETAVYSVMWSEHCSYKNSILWLKTLPKDGPHMLVKAGEENAGLVDIGDGDFSVMHNSCWCPWTYCGYYCNSWYCPGCSNAPVPKL